MANWLKIHHPMPKKINQAIHVHWLIQCSQNESSYIYIHRLSYTCTIYTSRDEFENTFISKSWGAEKFIVIQSRFKLGSHLLYDHEASALRLPAGRSTPSLLCPRIPSPQCNHNGPGTVDTHATKKVFIKFMLNLWKSYIGFF